MSTQGAEGEGDLGGQRLAGGWICPVVRPTRDAVAAADAGGAKETRCHYPVSMVTVIPRRRSLRHLIEFKPRP